jgi:hypothetical protein
MRTRWNVVLGGSLGLIACALWAVGLAIYQPRVDRERLAWYPDHFIAQNSSYWARELRLSAILLAVAALVIVAGWHRRMIGLAVAWIAADLLLDRLGVAGETAALICGGAAFAGWLVIAFLLPKVARREYPAAVVCVALAVAAAHLQTPDQQVPPAVAVSGAILTAAFTMAALLLAHLAHPARPGLLAALMVFAPMMAGIVWWRYLNGEVTTTPQLFLLIIAPATLLLLAVTYLTRRSARPMILIGVPIGAFVMSVATIVMVVLGAPIAELLTAASGNAPVHAADTDAVIALYALVGGVLTALFMDPVTRPAPGARPVTTGSAVAADYPSSSDRPRAA